MRGWIGKGVAVAIIAALAGLIVYGDREFVAGIGTGYWLCRAVEYLSEKIHGRKEAA